VSQIFIENAVQGLDITINGDGSDKLDFTYIDDLIQGVTLTIENKKARNETFNMTYGEARTIGEMAEILKDHFEGININYLPKDSLTPDRGTLNVDKARDLLGYQPENSIDVGYPKYINWYKSFWDSMKK
jgi:nucleoside-diphosphate-sugar epimerase